MIFYFLGIKFFLDVFSPFRDLNFIITNIVLIFLFFKTYSLSKKILSRLITFVFLMSIIFTLASINSSNVIILLKYIDLLFISIIFIHISYYNDPRTIGLELKKSLILAMFCFSFLLLISVLIGRYQIRMLYNFEHVNLFGSYILSFILLIYIINKTQQIKTKTYNYIVIIFTMLSKSTGAFLLSFLPLFNLKKLTLTHSISFILVVSISIYLGITLLYYVNIDLYNKILAPIYFLYDYKLNDIYEMALSHEPLRVLDDKYDSSMVWRLYAYMIFIAFFAESSYVEMFIGHGINGYQLAWENIMPHNDFLLILIDFGIIGFLLFIYAIYRSLKYSLISKDYLLFSIIFMYIIRLFLENNIYSYYISSNMIIFISILYGIKLRNRG